MTESRQSSQFQRIVAIDGGPGILNSLRCLMELEEYYLVRDDASFLAQADMFAGTSAGAVAALFLASRDWARLDQEQGQRAGQVALRGCIGLLEEIMMRTPSRRQLGRIILGRGPVFDVEWLEACLQSRYGDLRLADIDQRRVVALSYRIRHGTGELRNRVPRPIFYHNMSWDPEVDDDDPTTNGKWLPSGERHTRLVDVALRSGAFPMMFPVRDGDVDGGVYANNPALGALLYHTSERRTAHLSDKNTESRRERLGEVLMVSVGSRVTQFGTPLMQRAMRRWRNVGWGYLDWFMKPLYLMAFADVVINSNTSMTNEAAHYLLGRNYARVAPNSELRLVDEYLTLMEGRANEICRRAREIACDWRHSRGDQKTLAEGLPFLAMLDWVDDVLWFPRTQRSEERNSK